jgi:hypothetical protein
MLLENNQSKYKNEIDQALLKEVIAGLNIVQILEEEYGVTFESTSKGEFKACCPLPGHLDANPSFFANPEKGVFKCWGCSRGGNIITFIQMVENLNFYQSVLRLSEISGESLTAQYSDTFKHLRNVKKSIEEYLNRSIETDLPGGLNDTDFMFLLSTRLKKYEREFNDITWTDQMYKAFDRILLLKDYKLVSKMWDSLSLDISDRKKELKNGTTCIEN